MNKLLSTFILLFSIFHFVYAEQSVKNIIMLVPDGFGPAGVTLARDYQGAPLNMDSYLIGKVSTLSADSLVTDSASSATAYSTGYKTDNEMLALSPEGETLETVLETAQTKEMRTGLVVTSRITHATPAAYYAHINHRDKENAIALQLSNKNIDVIFGGGRRHFMPQQEMGYRTDDLNLMTVFQQLDYQIVNNKVDFMQPLRIPVIGLFAYDHMDYEIDRDPHQQPSLAEMTTAALMLLSENNDNGFFLLIEGSRIDHAAHSNDLATHIRDILAFDEALAIVMAFAEQDGETLVISVADHETGGLTLGRDSTYFYRPQAASNTQQSLIKSLHELQHGTPLIEVLQKLGITDITEETINSIDTMLFSDEQVQAFAKSFSNVPEHPLVFANDYRYTKQLMAIADILNKNANVAWTTYAHTGVDVNLYAYGPTSDALQGQQDNTAVGKHIMKLLKNKNQ